MCVLCRITCSFLQWCAKEETLILRLWFFLHCCSSTISEQMSTDFSGFLESIIPMHSPVRAGGCWSVWLMQGAVQHLLTRASLHLPPLFDWDTSYIDRSYSWAEIWPDLLGFYVTCSCEGLLMGLSLFSAPCQQFLTYTISSCLGPDHTFIVMTEIYLCRSITSVITSASCLGFIFCFSSAWNIP